MDSKNQQKDISISSNEKDVSSIQKDANPIDFFAKDPGFVFVYKKTEKLATALYMVTNLFGDVEPMKWTLRTKVSNLLSFIVGFKDVLKSREEEFSNEVKTKVLEIVSLLEVVSRSGLISNMNFSILKTEFMNMVKSLSYFREKSTPAHHLDLKENFFADTKSSKIESRIIHHRQGEFYKGHIYAGADIKDIDTLGTPKKTNRQNIIIGLLKRGKDLTIKDISHVIRDCSEKTIQRELIDLIELRVVKKIGERRWSKYSLIVNSQ